MDKLVLRHRCQLLLWLISSVRGKSEPFSSFARFEIFSDTHCIYCACPYHAEPVDGRPQIADNCKQCIYGDLPPSGYLGLPMSHSR